MATLAQVMSLYLCIYVSDQVLNLSSDVLKQVPELIDYESTYKLICDDMNPLNVVLLQEVWMHHTCNITMYIHVHACSM